jgi:2-keto-3-deoxy-6-phosphogluconate aldolase
MTPSDIEGAMSFGVKVMKCFPAGAAYGIKMLSSISAPWPAVYPNGRRQYRERDDLLRESSRVLAIGRAWIMPRQDFVNNHWKAIAENCRSAIAVSRLVRPIT